jgi:hypothetical protein
MNEEAAEKMRLETQKNQPMLHPGAYIAEGVLRAQEELGKKQQRRQ